MSESERAVNEGFLVKSISKGKNIQNTLLFVYYMLSYGQGEDFRRAKMGFWAKLHDSFWEKFYDFFKNDADRNKGKSRYTVLGDPAEWVYFGEKRTSYKIMDNKENVKLGLHIGHAVYDAGDIPHEEYPDGNLNGVTTSVGVTVGDFYKFPFDKGVTNFSRSATVYDKNLKGNVIATDADADFALYTQLMEEISRGGNNEQAVLMYALLKEAKSDILISSSRVAEQKKKQEEKEKRIQEERENYLKGRQMKIEAEAQSAQKSQVKYVVYIQSSEDKGRRNR